MTDSYFSKLKKSLFAHWLGNSSKFDLGHAKFLQIVYELTRKCLRKSQENVSIRKMTKEIIQ